MGDDYLFWYSFGRLQHAAMDTTEGFQAGMEALVPDGVTCWNLDLSLKNWFVRPEGELKIVFLKDDEIPNEIKLLCTLLNLPWRND